MTNDELRLAIAEKKGFVYDSTPHEQHEWLKTEDGLIDIFGMEADRHNGPRCIRCGYMFCLHCVDGYSDELPCIETLKFPNWPTDIAAAWELVEEMVVDNVSLEHDDGWSCCYARNEFIHCECSHTAPRAICLAWLAWKEASKP